MKIKSSFVIIFIVSLLFSQEEIIHINKTHRDGTPKEVIVYKVVNNDLQSNNPFEIVNTISYDTKGNWIRPKLGQLDKLIVGTWFMKENDYNDYVIFKKNGLFEFYDEDRLESNGKWFLTTKTENGEKITYLNFKGKEEGQSQTVSGKFMGKNKFISDDGTTLRRKIK
jgi:hypothetical protein